MIERARDFLERSFLPGRTFTSPTDFNDQLNEWLELVNARPRHALGCVLTDRITADRQAMLGLPPVAPQTGWRRSAQLPRDHYTRLDSNDYSVHPSVIGRRIEIVADLDRVRVFCEGRVVADRERIWAWHQNLSDPDPIEAAKMLRCSRISVIHPAAEPQVEQRCLTDCDAALGIFDIEGGVA